MKRISIFKRLLILVLVFILSINSFAAIVSDNDGATFITKAEFDSLKHNFQAQIDNYNTSIDSKIEGAIASYLSGIQISHESLLNNLYKSKGGSALKWLNLVSLTTSPETADTLAGGIMLYGIGPDNAYTGAEGKSVRVGSFGNIIWNRAADNNYPYWANSSGGWATAYVVAHVNPNWTGTWPSSFELNQSYKQGTTRGKLLRYYTFSKRIFIYGDVYWGQRLVTGTSPDTARYRSGEATAYLHMPYKNLADGEYFEAAWFNWYKANGTTVETDLFPNYTILNYEDVQSFDLSDTYNIGALTTTGWNAVRCTFEADKYVWQKGSVPWINPVDRGHRWYTSYSGTTTRTDNMSWVTWPDSFFTSTIPPYPERLTKVYTAADIYANNENENVPIYAGALVTTGCNNGTVEFDITFNKGTKVVSAPASGISYVGISFNSVQYSNSDSLTGNLRIVSCTASGYNETNKMEINTLETGKTYHIIIEIPNNNTELWMRIQCLDSIKNIITDFGPYVTANIGDIKSKEVV